MPDPERFGVVVYGEDGGRDRRGREGGGRRHALRGAAFERRGRRASTATRRDVFEIIRGLAPSSRGELEITDVNRWYAERGRLRSARVSGWWRDAGTHEALGRIGNLIDETGANKPA